MDGKVINIDPEILGGTPVFFGTRVPIKNLFDYLETGDSIEIFLEDFDSVSKEQVVKVLEMSQKLIESSANILNENIAWRMRYKTLENTLTGIWGFFTVRESNLSGVKNGKLMTFCAENSFDILLTIDKNLMFQQKLEKYPITIVVLNSLTSKIEELITFLPSFKAQVDKLEKHKAYIIEK